MVRRLLQHGCRVAIWDYSEQALTDVQRELGENPALLYINCDISDPASVTSAVQATMARFGSIDILVNNAGTVVSGYLQDTDMARQQQVIDVNFSGLVHATTLILPKMYAQDFGVIVNISSAAGTLGVARQSVYSAAKWAVWGFTESLWHEVRNQNKSVHVASVHPGYIATGLFAGAKIRGLGGVIVPLVKNHDVIAKAIVEQAIRHRKTVVYRPRSVRLAVLLRGILPDRWFFRLVRLLGIHRSMEGFTGQRA
ncbi:SDR family NAD(P)-dependent oxidoreductase [Spirochaeta africana]|uniref:SDR family NAD(P)-dependent oxidoreductase n=1 Tax=Spirochaeta africana TaxID=46355 RepID=UPI00145E8BF7|nr:SDR family NAD(P)-dependent oxidoreductase [Spirochaeta africana]